MAFISAAAKGASVLFMVACMVTSVVSSSSHVAAAPPKFSHVVASPYPQLSAFETVSKVMLTVERFLPCLEALKGVEGCGLELVKAVFGVPIDASCCQVVNQIAKTCVPKEFPLSPVFLPVALEKCIVIDAAASPANI